MTRLDWILWGSAGACGLVVLHHLALFAERRGWLYYRTARGGGGGALSTLQAMFDPSAEALTRVVAEAGEHNEDDDESGDGDGPLPSKIGQPRQPPHATDREERS